MRTIQSFPILDLPLFKEKLFHWAQQFEEIIWLDSNSYEHKSTGDHEVLLAVEAFTSIQTDYESAFEKLNEYQQHTKDWIFGYLTYDLKNDTEKLTSNNIDRVEFPDLSFFQPKKLIYIKENRVTFEYMRMVDDEIEIDFEEIKNGVIFEDLVEGKRPKIKLRLTKDQYEERISKMKERIAHGDIYEANFCQEFYAEDITINPIATYKALNRISKPPMASFLKMEDRYVLCASPERYIKKENLQIVSQPIKGTAKRNKDSLITDKELAASLKKDPKERSENIMIVDLVRNDLSKTAIKGSVKVNELCKIYSFEQVHQMISTVESTIEASTLPVEVLKTTFPMGSMTGAPKISAMKIIEELEVTKRGLYSGSIGYFSPNGDFDFNVVIRSILYNESKKYLSLSVGSAITNKSVISAEYEECLLKAKALRKVL